MENLKIIIAGGSGFIGQAMAARWAGANEVIILSRMNNKAANNSYGKQAHPWPEICAMGRQNYRRMGRQPYREISELPL